MASATVRLTGRRIHIVRHKSACDGCPDQVAHTVVKSPRLLKNELRQRVIGDASALAALRQIVAQHGFLGGLHRVRDAEVLEHLSQLLATGRLTAVECHARPPRLAATTPAGADEAPPAPPPPVSKKIKTWIEIELLDEESGAPVPFERYEIELPDGTKTRGTLDKKGRARVDEIDPGGMCQVSFPGIDGREWKGA